MKFLFFAFLSLPAMALQIQVQKAPEPNPKKIRAVDFTTDFAKIPDGVLLYASDLIPYGEWINRNSAGGLLIKLSDSAKRDVEFFEARGVAIVKRPIAYFTQAYLHNIETLRKLNPLPNRHERIAGPDFVVETVVPFPSLWAEAIGFLKKTTFLDDKTTDHLRMTSQFIYYDKKQIETKQQELARNLDVRPPPVEKLPLPGVINLQGTTKVNQIAYYITIATLFYEAGPQRTVVVNHMAVALKRHILRIGVDYKGLKFNGQSVLMGENMMLNTNQGIGAGLPVYASMFFNNMLMGLEK